MKIIRQPWKTRYKELAIDFSCKKCGTEFTAEGEDFSVHRHGTVYSYSGSSHVTVLCPTCHNEICAESAINEVEDAEMVEYIRSLPPTYWDIHNS